MVIEIWLIYFLCMYIHFRINEWIILLLQYHNVISLSFILTLTSSILFFGICVFCCGYKTLYLCGNKRKVKHITIIISWARSIKQNWRKTELSVCLSSCTNMFVGEAATYLGFVRTSLHAFHSGKVLQKKNFQKFISFTINIYICYSP